MDYFTAEKQNEEYLGVKDIAALFKVSPRSVWKQTKLPEFPKPFCISRYLQRWSKSEVIDYFQNFTPDSTAKSRGRPRRSPPGP